MFRPPKFYAEWKKQLAKNRNKAAEIAKDVDGDVQLIKRYLDDEEEYIKRELEKEQKTTDDQVDDLDKKHKKESKDAFDPLIKKNDDLRDIINNILDLKERGKEGEEEINLLDDVPGPKTGIKIYFNNLFNVSTGNPLKIEFAAYIDKEKIFDEFGNPGDYLLPLIDGHVDYEALVL